MEIGQSFLKSRKDAKKGQNGTILVIGGNKIYTGAPLFAGRAALRSGSELLFIMTPSTICMEALKIFPEAAVSLLEFNEKILSRITACVIGPGLVNLDVNSLSIIIKIMQFLDKKSVPLILDADAIHYYKTGDFRNFKNIILTPNFHEAIGLKECSSHMVVFKGPIDRILHNGTEYLAFNKGSEKRCGGLGDILSGVLSTSVSLGGFRTVEACVSACQLTRHASYLAFNKYGYGLIASDVIEMIPFALSDCKKRIKK